MLVSETPALFSGPLPTGPVARSTRPRRPALLWREALADTCRQLVAEGWSADRAAEEGEAAVIACALRGDPGTFEEARLLLNAAVQRRR